jgi:hypothetical protein
MTVTLQIPAEYEPKVVNQAKERGIAVTELVLSLVAQWAARTPEQTNDTDWIAGLDALGRDSDSLPVLDPRVFDRAYIYGDHN